MPFLNTEESFSFSFLIHRNPILNPITKEYEINTINYKSLGFPLVKWYTSMGEFGTARGDELLTLSTQTNITTTINNNNTTNNRISTSTTLINNPINIITSGTNLSNDYNKGIRLKCLSVPATIEIGNEFQAQIRIINSTSQYIPIALCNKPIINTSVTSLLSTNIIYQRNNNKITSDMELFSGNNNTFANNTFPTMDNLCLVGLSYLHIGDIAPYNHKDITLTFCALACGLQDCREIIAIDTSLNKEYYSGSLFKILVTDSDIGNISHINDQ